MLRTRRPALPGRLRGPVAVLATLAVAGLAGLGIRYAGVAGEGRLDAAVDAAIIGWFAGLDLTRIAYLADPIGVVIGAVAVAVAAVATRRWRVAAVALLGPLLAGVATTTLQPLVGRTLQGGFALPSGHTAGATAVAAVAVLLALGLARRRIRALAVAGFALVVLISAVMAVSLIASGFHYLTDTVAGFCTGAAAVATVALAVDPIVDRASRKFRPSTC